MRTQYVYYFLIFLASFAVGQGTLNENVYIKQFAFGAVFTAMAWSILHKNVYLPAQPVFWLIFTCLIIIPLRDGLTSGVNPELMVYPVGLLLMLFLLMNTYSKKSLTGFDDLLGLYLSGVIVAFAAVLAGYGLLQYAGVFRSFNPNFNITGSFDNPAGFAAALCFTLPFAFYLICKTTGTFRYISIAAFAVILAGITFSGSRAAVVSCLVVAACYLCSRFSGIRFRKWMPGVIIAALVASVTILYFLKKDSADGRLLIWQCTRNTVKDSPLIGHGQGAFQAKYMLYQADYFETHPDSRYAALADNVLHPFNEYLLVLSEHGIIGLCALALLYFLLIRSYRRRPDFIKFTAGLSLTAVAVFSCFSYSFKYPFTWVIAFLNIALICSAPERKPVRVNAGRLIKAGTMVISVVLFLTAIPLLKAEMIWNKTAKASLMGKTEEMLPEYDKLYRYLGKNGLFLYNHAAELNHIKKYKESLQVFAECTRYYNDMDVQMLLADNYKAIEQYGQAEQHLKLAANMCPGRFMPLYELALLYGETGRKKEAIDLASYITDKEVKIQSYTVSLIKEKMRQLILEFKK